MEAKQLLPPLRPAVRGRKLISEKAASSDSSWFAIHAYSSRAPTMPPAARLTDMHACPAATGPMPHVGGPVAGPCSPNVFIGGLPAARVNDMAVCVGPTDVIVKGSPTVFINGLPAARIGDSTAHGGVIVSGWPSVIIGDLGMGGISTVFARSLSAARKAATCLT
jgi:uncharacterized Zn-binding protein involved in type VI secretion